MNNENRQAFFNHALMQMPREACALLLIENGKEKLFICKNIALENDQFEIDSRDYIKAETLGEIIGVVHSHVFTTAQPSDADKVACEISKLKWFICSVPTGKWFEFQPSGFRAPLVGRQFMHGLLDCYALVRDYFRETLQIEIPDFERENEWYLKGQKLLNIENWTKAGFHEIDLTDLRRHDGLLMQIHAPVINHCGIYLGEDLFLHHLGKRLSSRDVFSGFYRMRTVRAVRFKGL